MKKFICILLVIVMCVPMMACTSSTDSSRSTTIASSSSKGSSSYSEKSEDSIKIETESQAIDAAKNCWWMADEIADRHFLEFYYDPEYGRCTAEENTYSWTVTLRGTISGYKDSYKSDFVYGQKFTVIVSVPEDGEITIRNLISVS